MSAPIIVLDIETTSLSRINAGIVEIGAENLLTGAAFEIKLRPHADRSPDQDKALEINGCDWLEDPTVACEQEAIEGLHEWIGTQIKGSQPGAMMSQRNGYRVVMAGHNCGQFDYTNLEAAFVRCAVPWPFAVGVIDMHSLACQQAGLRHVHIPLKSREIYAMLDMPEEPKPHRALTGATMEAAAIRALMWSAPTS